VIYGVSAILWIAQLLLLYILLRLSFTLKLINCNSLLLNLPACYSDQSSPTCSHFCCACAVSPVTRTLKLHHITPILISFHCLTINKRIQYRVLCFSDKSLKLVTHLISAPFCQRHLVVLLVLHLSLHFIVLLSLLVWNYQIDLSFTLLRME
jgi:hypothetical protein